MGLYITYSLVVTVAIKPLIVLSLETGQEIFVSCIFYLLYQTNMYWMLTVLNA